MSLGVNTISRIVKKCQQMATSVTTVCRASNKYEQALGTLNGSKMCFPEFHHGPRGIAVLLAHFPTILTHFVLCKVHGEVCTLHA